jgi:spermidine synthase
MMAKKIMKDAISRSSKIITFLLCSSVFLGASFGFTKEADPGIDWAKAGVYHSEHLGSDIVFLPGVVHPKFSEITFLPFMEKHKELFQGKKVLDIGTGCGILALYAAKLKAAKVVATDIDARAIANAKRNSQLLGFSSIIETRLVPAEDTSAYSVIKEDEKFDVIISVPSGAVDLDSKIDTEVIDKGDLGFSILKGLPQHLQADGIAVLRYTSLFYHEVLAKYGRYLGYNVRDYPATTMLPEEMDILFNSYLARILKHEGLPADAFRFDLKKEKKVTIKVYNHDTPVVEYPGFITIATGEGSH